MFPADKVAVRSSCKPATENRTGTSRSEVNIVKSQCPPDPSETAEAAYMGRLDPNADEAFKAHLVGCAECRGTYEETVAFVDAIRHSSEGSLRLVR